MDGKRKVGNIFGGISLGAFAVNILTLLFAVIYSVIVKPSMSDGDPLIPVVLAFLLMAVCTVVSFFSAVIGIIITRSKLTVSAFIVTVVEVVFFICLCRAI